MESPDGREIFAISLETSAVKRGPITILDTVLYTAVLRKGEYLSDKKTKDSIALGIYRAFEENFENAQGKAGMWFTHYSFEDLTSDEIGFYLYRKFGETVDPRDNNGKNEDAWNWLAKTCGFDSNRQIAIENSKKVFLEIGGPWGLGKTIFPDSVKKWGTPMFCGNKGLCTDFPNKWPQEFMDVIPASANRRNGAWWKYNEILDGELVNSGSEGIFFLK